MQKPPNYRTFILRLWPVDDGPEATWRTSLQDVHGGVRRSFASLEDAFATLLAEIPGVGAATDAADDDVGSI